MDKKNLMTGELADGSNFSEESNAALRESAKNAAEKGVGKVSEEDNRAVDYGLPTQPGDGAEIDDVISLINKNDKQKIDEVLDLANKVYANRDASQKKASRKEKSSWTAPLNEVPLGEGAYGVIAPQKKTGATATNWDEAVAAQGVAKSNKANGYTRNVIAQNRAIAEQGKTNEAKQSLALFDGLAAALDALKADTSKSEDYTKRVRNPVEFNHDDQGRILGQKDTTYTDKVMGKVAGGNGYQREEGGFRKGFVQRDVVNALNNTLKERGANYRIAGVMAKQRLNGIGEPTGEPVFYVEKIGEDGNRRGAYYTMRQVAQMGLDGYKATGGGDDDGNEFVISALGGDDPLGYGTRREAHRMAAQKGLSLDDRLAIEREKNKGKIDVENARGQNRIDLANLTGEQKKELQNSINAMKKYGIDVTSAVRMATSGNRTKNVPFNDKVFTYYSNRLDVLNSKGTLTAAEQKERDKAQRIVDGMTNGVMGIEEKQETPDWMSAFASGDAANTAKPQNREGQKSAQNAQMQKPSNAKAAQATVAPQVEPQGKPQTTKEQTMSAKPQGQQRETAKLTPAEQSVGRDAVAMFKKIHPDITDVDDNPEKYDKQLTSIAQSLSGDYNYKSNFALQKEHDRKAAQDKRLQQTATEQEDLRKQTLANLNRRDKAVYQKAMELYAPLYERAKLQAREDHGGDYEESVRKKFAEYVNEYNKKHGLKFVDGLSRPDRQVFGDYHVADLLSDIFGNDAGKYLGPVGSRGNSQLRLQSHGKNK